MGAREKPERVFLNVPFDADYEPVFIGLVAALIDLGRRPVTVVDVDGPGRPRIDRLLDLIRSCDVSVHDLSRVQSSGRGRNTTPRFNMPFELGLAVAISRMNRRSRHAFAILEAKPFRLQRSLSDMNAYDPLIHGGTSRGAVRCMFDLFADVPAADIHHARQSARRLAVTAVRLKHEHGTKTIFNRLALRGLIGGAAALQYDNAD